LRRRRGAAIDAPQQLERALAAENRTAAGASRLVIAHPGGA